MDEDVKVKPLDDIDDVYDVKGRPMDAKARKSLAATALLIGFAILVSLATILAMRGDWLGFGAILLIVASVVVAAVLQRGDA